jgi:hypothetical protein
MARADIGTPENEPPFETQLQARFQSCTAAA